MRPLIDLSLRSWFVDAAGKAVTRNIGGLAGTVQLGDGTTIGTFPTQLGRAQCVNGGMSFDGGDYLVHTSAIASGTYTACFLMQRLSNGANQYLFDARAGGGTGYCYWTGAALSAGSGTIYVNEVVTATMPYGQLYFVAVVGTTIIGPSGLVIFASNAPPGAALTGSIFGFRLDLGTLSPTQLRDVRNRMLSRMTSL